MPAPGFLGHNPLVQALPRSLYADLLGKPFVEGARGPEAYDCVGLAMELERRRGAVLPAYLSDAAELHRQLAAGGAFSECERLPFPTAGCAVLMRSLGGPARHIGVMLDPVRMIHASLPAKSVVIEALARSLWGARVLGFYGVPLT